MIQREIIKNLNEWAQSEDRKPLVLRGARQVGKTTVVKEFAKQFDTFLSINLDLEQDCIPFLQHDDIFDIVNAIYQHCGKAKRGKTLLFVDEIQNSPKAIAKLRYFYEEIPELFVIAAGSLLESLIDTHVSFPVGRVEYMVLRPCSFLEFLNGIGEDFDADLLRNLDAQNIHQRLMARFFDYAVVGGMPAAVNVYSKKRDVFATDKVYNSLLISYMDDVLKYEKRNKSVNILRYIIQNGWNSASTAITFHHFAEGNYKSDDVADALRILERTLLLELVYPLTSTRFPFVPNHRKHPKLIWLDTGMVNYFSGIRKDLFSVSDITDVWRGRIAEHIVAQELIASDNDFLTKRLYWNKDKSTSSAEVDFVFPYKGMLIPIEVKSGHNAKLRSLHIFMDDAPHNIAVRVWSQPFSIDEVKTLNGKIFKLINLPFYYVGQLQKVLDKIQTDYSAYQ